MTDHPSLETFELFTMGALEDDAAFVAHVAGCDACSARLQREAELELLMKDVPVRTRGRGLRLALPLVAVAAAAAAAVFLAVRGPGPAPFVTADPAVPVEPVARAGMALPPQMPETDGPDMQELVKPLNVAVRPCFEVMVATHAEGHVKIELTVAADGTIQRAILVEAAHDVPEAVGQCFVRAVGPVKLRPWPRAYTRQLSWAYVPPPVSR